MMHQVRPNCEWNGAALGDSGGDDLSCEAIGVSLDHLVRRES
jgi:hypothetical protein